MTLLAAIPCYNAAQRSAFVVTADSQEYFENKSFALYILAARHPLTL